VAFCDRFTSGFSALRQAAAVFDAQADVPVDVVVESVPGWAGGPIRGRAPGGRGREYRAWVVTVWQGTKKVLIDRREIQSARMVGGSDGS